MDKMASIDRRAKLAKKTKMARTTKNAKKGKWSGGPIEPKWHEWRKRLK